jgi:hypothetical protein
MDLNNLKKMIGEEIKWIDYQDNNFILTTNSNKISIKTDSINICKNYKIQSRTPAHSLSEDFLSEENYLCYFDVRTKFIDPDEKHYTCLLNKEQLEQFIHEDTISIELDNRIYYCKYNSHRKLIQSDIYFINSLYSNNIVNNLISVLNCDMKQDCDNVFY